MRVLSQFLFEVEPRWLVKPFPTGTKTVAVVELVH